MEIWGVPDVVDEEEGVEPNVFGGVVIGFSGWGLLRTRLGGLVKLMFNNSDSKRESKVEACDGSETRTGNPKL